MYLELIIIILAPRLRPGSVYQEAPASMRNNTTACHGNGKLLTGMAGAMQCAFPGRSPGTRRTSNVE
jgi:hypothetical protein